ncbi:MAG: hypothetical protein EOP48_06225 [Sphingobacteriales bacterium]|nr:MAG: hypothetical protein EOP48_06225 [Sphingobacteriales bacterium]
MIKKPLYFSGFFFYKTFNIWVANKIGVAVANYVLLDNNTHKDLKILTGFSSELGDNVGYTLVLPNEFRQIQAHYPIVFRKDAETKLFESMALLGLQEDENLYIEHDHWHASYVPLTVRRKPFLIGFRNNNKDDPVIYVDSNSPRVNYKNGEKVFLEFGGNSDYLKSIGTILTEILDGIDVCRAFINTLMSFDLLEPFTLKMELDNSSVVEVSAFHTINEDKLRALDADSLGALHSKGYLELIYMIIASLSNFRTLIDKKNKRAREILS